jgi:hypothetical protein
VIPSIASIAFLVQGQETTKSHCAPVRRGAPVRRARTGGWRVSGKRSTRRGRRSMKPNVVLAWLLASTASGASVVEAGQGWYLLTPPVTNWLERYAREAVKPENKRRTPDAIMMETLKDERQRPFREGIHVGSFDSAKACQQEADDGLKKTQDTKRSPVPGDVLLRVQYTLARCIASDDPRLK